MEPRELTDLCDEERTAYDDYINAEARKWLMDCFWTYDGENYFNPHTKQPEELPLRCPQCNRQANRYYIGAALARLNRG